MKPLACITCGPAFEPIDVVRRITNFATGEIGRHLAAALVEDFDPVLFRGEGATDPGRAPGEVRMFSTNESLATGLRSLARVPDVIFHAAALCDFTVVQPAGAPRKIESRSGHLTLELAPAPKLLPQMKVWFPSARVVGWKYEMDGGREQVIARGLRQLRECRTDACVLNGAAYGAGFGILFPDETLHHLPDKISLSAALAKWAAARA